MTLEDWRDTNLFGVSFIESGERVDPNKIKPVWEEDMTSSPEQIAKQFHETYERLAPEFNYETRLQTRVPWEDVPKDNRELMVAVVEDLIYRRVILTTP